MYKFSPIFFCLMLVLFGCLSNEAIGQTTGNPSQPLPKINSTKDTILTGPQALPSSPERKAEAKKLYEEGMKLFEAGEFSQAAETFQQSIRLDAEYAEAYSGLGRSYFKLQQWQQAVYNLRRAEDLNKKQREAKNALQQKPSTQNSRSASSEKAHPTSLQIKPPQAKNVNSVASNTAPPESTPTSKFAERKENSPQVPTPDTSLALKQPKATNANANSVKALMPAPNSSPQPDRSKVNNTLVTTSAPNTAGTKQQQTTDANANGPKPLSSGLGISSPVDQSKATSAAPTVSPAIPNPKQQQATNATANGRKPLSSGSGTPRPVEQQSKATSAAPTTPTGTAATKQQQTTNANANGLKPLIPALDRAGQSEERQQTNVQADAALPNSVTKQPTDEVTADVRTPGQESVAMKAPPHAVTGLPALKNDEGSTIEQKQRAVGVRDSLNPTPPTSRALEAKSVTPVSLKTSSGDASLTKIYRVGPSDVLDVSLNDSQSTKSTLFTVAPSGMLEYPLLDEPLLVTGFTVDEIATKIEEELKKRAVIENPQVAVGVRDYASHSILVSGLVKDSGTRFLRREAIPLYVVVADAQPLPEAAKVSLVRNEQNQMYEIDLSQAADMNLLVRSGDVITLQAKETQYIYIGGEVKLPGEKLFRRGLTLTQAIITAGGVTDKSKVAEISRNNGQGFLVGTRFNLRDIGSGKSADPVLQPGDRIMILQKSEY